MAERRAQLKAGRLMKPRILTIALLFVAAVVSSCRTPTEEDHASLVTSLRFSPSAFDSFRRNTEIRYTLKEPSTISISIARRDSTGQLFLVNTVAQHIYETKGTHSHTWLGDTQTGFFAPSGFYLGILQIGNQQYETAVRVFHF